MIESELTCCSARLPTTCSGTSSSGLNLYSPPTAPTKIDSGQCATSSSAWRRSVATRSRWALWSSRKSPRLNPTSKRSSTISKCVCSHNPEIRNLFKVLLNSQLHGKHKRKRDKSMRHLTILLDPGRLKRGAGPNRELGPPLKSGQKYTLTIGSEMIDFSGRSLGESFYKSFHLTEAVREPIAVEQWKLLPPATKSNQPLVLMFPKPLDWALLWRTITIASEGGQPMDGRLAIDQGERRWSFTPTSPCNSCPKQTLVRQSTLGLEPLCGRIDCISAKKPGVGRFDWPMPLRLVGTRSRAIRGSMSNDRVGCSASDGRCAPARPALHVSTRLCRFCHARSRVPI